MNTGDVDSSDLRQQRTAADATFVSFGVRRQHFQGGAFVILSAVYGLRSAHRRSLVSGDVRSHDPESNCIVSSRLRNAARVVARLPTESSYC